jgi:hypothetical protein
MPSNSQKSGTLQYSIQIYEDAKGMEWTGNTAFASPEVSRTSSLARDRVELGVPSFTLRSAGLLSFDHALNVSFLFETTFPDSAGV